MARVTIEDCLDNIENRYELVLITAKRTRQILNGSSPLVSSKNKSIVTALREVAKGVVKKASEEQQQVLIADDDLDLMPQ